MFKPPASPPQGPKPKATRGRPFTRAEGKPKPEPKALPEGTPDPGKKKSYWDRMEVKRLSVEQRRQVEGYLARGGMSQMGIARTLGWPVKMKGKAGVLIIGAVKLNPIPGGPLDPNGEVAAVKGFWIEGRPQSTGERGVKRPWLGFGKDGKPILGEPMGHEADNKAKEFRTKTDTQRQLDKAARRRDRMADANKVEKGVMTTEEFMDKWVRPNPSPVLAPGLGNPGMTDPGLPSPGLPQDGGADARDISAASTRPIEGDEAASSPAPLTTSSLPQPRPYATDPMAHVRDARGKVDESPGGKKRSRSMLLARTRKLTHKYLPLEKRIQILAAHAMNWEEEPQVSLKAIQEINQLEGVTALVKDAGAAQQGAGALFSLPVSTGGNAALLPQILMGISPVVPSTDVSPPKPTGLTPSDSEPPQPTADEEFRANEDTLVEGPGE